MELKDYEKKIGHSVEEMTYEELSEFLEHNKEKSLDHKSSADEAYWLGRLFVERRITEGEFSKGLSLLREAVAKHKVFHRIFIEIEDPTVDEDDHWEFYLTEFPSDQPTV